MVFVKTFKGYEDKTMDLDATVNAWIQKNKVVVGDIKTVLSHEPGGRAGSGDLLYTVLYKADAPLD
ncbi:MAG: hypothetical protein JXR94_12170 [Candidatus Hydrogenedentes bacterium]|nr:hypothetical protein [Candidatus Hydrogenedentota bacterium]